DVLDRARTHAPGPHDLHRCGPRRGLHRAHVRHPGSLRPDPSVQIPPELITKPQLNELQLRQHPEHEPSRVHQVVPPATRPARLSHYANSQRLLETFEPARGSLCEAICLCPSGPRRPSPIQAINQTPAQRRAVVYETTVLNIWL